MMKTRRILLRDAAAVAAAAAIENITGPVRAEPTITGAFSPGEKDRQLPTGDEIFLDHVGHFVRDPAAASRALTQAGFAPAPVSIQTNPDPQGGAPRLTGTGNVTAMLRRGYLEMLFKTADTPLGRELDAEIARYPGAHLAALSVSDAAKAHQRLDDAGFRTRPLVQMQRPVETATGPGTASFTVTRVEPEAMAEGRIQILTHHTEETVWQERWLTHPNSAIGLIDLVIAVTDVDEAAARFARFTDRPAMANQAGRAVHLDRGRVQLVNTRTISTLLSGMSIPHLPFAGAYGVAVASLGTAQAMLRQGNVTHRREGDVIVARFPEELGIGAWFFVENAARLPWRG